MTAEFGSGTQSCKHCKRQQSLLITLNPEHQSGSDENKVSLRASRRFCLLMSRQAKNSPVCGVVTGEEEAF
jgi:hypothetical protein